MRMTKEDYLNNAKFTFLFYLANLLSIVIPISIGYYFTPKDFEFKLSDPRMIIGGSVVIILFSATLYIVIKTIYLDLRAARDYLP